MTRGDASPGTARRAKAGSSLPRPCSGQGWVALPGNKVIRSTAPHFTQDRLRNPKIGWSGTAVCHPLVDQSTSYLQRPGGLVQPALQGSVEHRRIHHTAGGRDRRDEPPSAVLAPGLGRHYCHCEETEGRRSNPAASRQSIVILRNLIGDNR